MSIRSTDCIRYCGERERGGGVGYGAENIHGGSACGGNASAAVRIASVDHSAVVQHVALVVAAPVLTLRQTSNRLVNRADLR